MQIETSGTIATVTEPEYQLVSDCPTIEAIGALVVLPATATDPSGSLRVHSKLEDATWTYSGRSYGVGSSQGLFNPADESAFTAYTYNLTSNFTLSRVGSEGYIDIIELEGALQT